MLPKLPKTFEKNLDYAKDAVYDYLEEIQDRRGRIRDVDFEYLKDLFMSKLRLSRSYRYESVADEIFLNIEWKSLEDLMYYIDTLTIYECQEIYDLDNQNLA